jgi:hypothetical protein
MDKWDFIKLKKKQKKLSEQQEKLSLKWRDHPQSRRTYLPAIHQTKDS